MCIYASFFFFVSGTRKRLKDGAIPSHFSFKKNEDGASTRKDRLEARFIKLQPAEVTVTEPTVISEIEVQTTITIEEENCPDPVVTVDVMEEKEDCGTQCNMNLLSSRWSFETLQHQAKLVQYYTAFENNEQYDFFFACLGPAAYELKKFSSLPGPKDQLLLTLMKLRQNKDDLELGFFFNIGITTVGDVFNTWINFMYYQLKELDLWPEAGVIESHMPKNFAKMFSKTKMIVDATETPIAKPEHVEAQSMTFSTYKNCNTVKTMVGCSPRCVTTYVSESYGGATSDRQIIERSTLLNDYPFQSKDQIMADRGIMVQDLFAPKDVQVITPHQLKGKYQLDSTTVIKDRRVASKRIHIERIIGLAKTFKILKFPLNGQKLHLANRIIFICLMINNFRKCIISRYG